MNLATPILSKTINTERLTLRPFTLADAQEVHRYLAEPAMSEFLEGLGTPPTLEESISIVERNIDVDWQNRCVWAITLDQLAVGAVSINFFKDHAISEIGYSVKKALWGQGFAKEAATAVRDCAFSNLPQLRRIQANIHPDNEASITVAQALGMQYEGTLRSYSRVKGIVVDESIYSVVRGT